MTDYQAVINANMARFLANKDTLNEVRKKMGQPPYPNLKKVLPTGGDREAVCAQAVTSILAVNIPELEREWPPDRDSVWSLIDDIAAIRYILRSVEVESDDNPPPAVEFTFPPDCRGLFERLFLLAVGADAENDYCLSRLWPSYHGVYGGSFDERVQAAAPQALEKIFQDCVNRPYGGVSSRVAHAIALRRHRNVPPTPTLTAYAVQMIPYCWTTFSSTIFEELIRDFNIPPRSIRDKVLPLLQKKLTDTAALQNMNPDSFFMIQQRWGSFNIELNEVQDLARQALQHVPANLRLFFKQVFSLGSDK